MKKIWKKLHGFSSRFLYSKNMAIFEAFCQGKNISKNILISEEYEYIKWLNFNVFVTFFLPFAICFRTFPSLAFDGISFDLGEVKTDCTFFGFYRTVLHELCSTKQPILLETFIKSKFIYLAWPRIQKMTFSHGINFSTQTTHHVRTER